MSKNCAAFIFAITLLLSSPSFAASIDFTGEGKSALVTIDSPSLGFLSTAPRTGLDVDRHPAARTTRVVLHLLCRPE